MTDNVNDGMDRDVDGSRDCLYWGLTEGACSMAVSAMSTRPMASALRMSPTHPAIMNANHR